METELATVEDVKNAAQKIDELWQEFDKRYNQLRAMETSPLKAALAREQSQDLKAYLAMVDASPLGEQKRRLFEAHKYASGVYNRACKRADFFLKYCSDVRAECEVVRRREIEALRRQREQEANELAAKQRQAEVEHLREIGKKAEAEARATAPVVPVTVSIDPNTGKPAGEMFVEVWVPKRDENEEIVFTDLGAFLKWVMENPAQHHLIKVQYAKLKKLLTDNRGMLQPPGLVVEHKFEPRTRMESDD